jgi:MinD-like ATPase involved in chromosome partitioning or flagellar assembly
MRMLVISIHSYRGGTGKTLLATNLAASYARNEKVCLLDYDVRAPSLHNLFDIEMPDWWVNDFLNEDCEINECITEAIPNLYVGLANPDSEAIREMMGKGRSWEAKALGRTITLKQTLTDMGFGKLIFDTAPGLAYSSINAVVGSDVTALVIRMDVLDILGTKEMVRGVYELLDKPTFAVVNMVLPEQIEAHSELLKKTFGDQTLAFLPCLCEVRGLIAKGQTILIDEELQYSDTLVKLAHDIENFYKSQA